MDVDKSITGLADHAAMDTLMPRDPNQKTVQITDMYMWGKNHFGQLGVLPAPKESQADVEIVKDEDF